MNTREIEMTPNEIADALETLPADKMSGRQSNAVAAAIAHLRAPAALPELPEFIKSLMPFQVDRYGSGINDKSGFEIINIPSPSRILDGWDAVPGLSGYWADHPGKAFVEDLSDDQEAELAQWVCDVLNARAYALAALAGKPTMPPFQCWSDDDGDTWLEHPADAEFVHGLKVGETYRLTAGWRCVDAVYLVTKAPDDASDDYEVECISHPEETHPALAGRGRDAADAARYRLLRRGQQWSVINGIGDTLRGDELDAEIDRAARAASAGKDGAE